MFKITNGVDSDEKNAVNTLNGYILGKILKNVDSNKKHAVNTLNGYISEKNGYC